MYMNQEKFIEVLAKEGFPKSVIVEKEPHGYIDQHAHTYEAKALVLSGQIDIAIDRNRAIYLAGDVFHLQANQIHSESYGSKGVKYLVGRKELG